VEGRRRKSYLRGFAPPSVFCAVSTRRRQSFPSVILEALPVERFPPLFAIASLLSLSTFIIDNRCGKKSAKRFFDRSALVWSASGQYEFRMIASCEPQARNPNALGPRASGSHCRDASARSHEQDSNFSQDGRLLFQQIRARLRRGKMNDEAYGRRFARLLDYIEQHLRASSARVDRLLRSELVPAF